MSVYIDRDMLEDFAMSCIGGVVTMKQIHEFPGVHVPPHGRLIDADAFLKRAIGTKCFRGDYALMLEELAGESTTIIPAEEDE